MFKRKKSSTPLTLEQAITALFCYKEASHSPDKTHVPEWILAKIQENFQQIHIIIDATKRLNETEICGKNAQDMFNAFARVSNTAKKNNIILFAYEIEKDC